MALTQIKRESASAQFKYERNDQGTPISEAERQKATDELIALLKQLPFFDFVDGRIHGVPESDPKSSYWWGVMWTGVNVKKVNGKVIFTHANNGSDNAGIQTSPYLESACYAYALTGDKKYAHLARRLMRGMSSWILAGARNVYETPKILSRVYYPPSTSSTDGGRDQYFNYDAARPGIDSKASDYVHNPNNPYLGDVWLKSKRSIDDIGHMIRAIAQIQSCRDLFDADALADLNQLQTLYSSWAADVDANNFLIPTYNANLEIYTKKNGFGDYNTYKILGFDPACVEKLAVRYLHSNDAKKLNCGNGISALEKISGKYLQNDAIEVLRSHHVAAAILAQMKAGPEGSKKLMKGIEERMNRDFSVAKNPANASKYDLQDIPSFLIHANNAGVPMTSEEIRYLYQRLNLAYKGMLDPSHYNTFHLFDSSVPDGVYSYDPPHIGLYFYSIGAMIGSCTSAFVNPNGRQLIDCDRLKAALTQN